MVIDAAMQERLIHHTALDAFASYGRGGGEGRDIVIGPSRTVREDVLFMEQIKNPETTVAALLDSGPNPDMQHALDTLMPVWNTARRGNVFMVHTADNARALYDGFMDAVRNAYKYERMPYDRAQESAMEAIRQDMRESIALFEGVADTDREMKFFSLYYPPASKPLELTHNWHTDVFPQNVVGKIRMQRSPNLEGLSFAFKEQASPDIKEGVGLSTGRATFKITADNEHRGAAVSPTEGRMIYTITAEPAVAYI